MSRTSSRVKDRYNAKAYDEMKIRVPKGQKAAVEAYAKQKGESVNSLVNRLLREDMGVSEDAWKRDKEEE